MLRLLVFAVVAWVAADLGWASFRPETTISLVWPVSGVAMIWAGTGNRRTWGVDAVVLTVVVGAALMVSGATLKIATMASVQVLAQTAVYLVLMTRLAPDLWSTGGRRPMTRLRDLGIFLLAAAVGATAGAAVRAAGLGLIAPASFIDASLVWMRNFGWLFVMGAVAMQLAPLVEGGWRSAGVRARAQRWWGGWAARLTESLLLVAVSAVVYLLVLSRTDTVPVTFVLLLPALWAALRLPPPVATLHALTSGVVVILTTLAGDGAFAAATEARVGATMAQAFMVAVMVTSLVISLVTAERIEATAKAVSAEHTTAERAALLSAVMEQIREGIIVVRDDGRVVMRNAALVHLVDDVQAVVGEALRNPTVYDPDGEVVPEADLPYARALRGEEVVAQELVLRPESGEPKVLEVSASALPPDAGHVDALVVVRDVTLVRQREDSLAAFAGVVAHDLNNPLTIVAGWADALADSFADGDVDSASGADMTTRIQVAAAHMRRFIDDLLSYTVARDQPLRLQPLDLSELAEQVARLRREGAAAPHIVVQPGLHVHGDEVLVRQLVDNLVGNAVKYVADGVRPEVTVSGLVRGDLLEVSVTDNGVGVPPHQRDRIFETFVRAHGSSYGGTGIGLCICRRVVQRHGGSIRVEEGPDGRGSRFVLTLPAAAAPAVTSDAPAPRAGRTGLAEPEPA